VLKKWKILKNQKVFECPWFSISKEKCLLSDGNILDDYYVIDSSDVVTIIAVDDKNQVVVLREYKHGLGDIIYTFPSGMIESGEDPSLAAIRELKEETGYMGDITLIHKTSPNPTSGRFCKYTFLAKNIKKVSDQNLDSTEFLEEELMSIKNINKLILEEKFVSDLSICSFYVAMQKIGMMKI